MSYIQIRQEIILYLPGFATASVFTIDVPQNSGASDDSSAQTEVKYYGRIKTVDTSGNESAWTPSSGLKESSETVLIESSHIRNLTASKITAGTINAHEIILKQQGAQTTISAPANMAILRSSDYNGSYNNSTNQWTAGTSGWVIAGNGYAEFSSASIRGGIKAGSVWIDSNNRWNRNAADTANVTEFRAGSSTKYLYFDGTNLTFTGSLSAVTGNFSGDITGSNGIFSGTLSGVDGDFSGTLSGADGTFEGQVTVADNTVKIGNNVAGGNETGVFIVTNDNSWYKRTNGSIFFSVGNSTSGIQLDTAGNCQIKFNGGVFQVNNNGSMTSTSGTIGGWTILPNELNALGGSVLMNSVTGDAQFNGMVIQGDSRIDGDIDNEDSSALFYHMDSVQSYSGYQAYFSGGSNSIRLGIYAGSARRFKDILGQPTGTLDPKNLLNIPVVTYKYKEGHLGPEEQNKDRVMCGLIAEDVEANYPSIVQYINGEIRGYNHIEMIAPMLKLIQDLYEKIDNLEDRLSELE